MCETGSPPVSPGAVSNCQRAVIPGAHTQHDCYHYVFTFMHIFVATRRDVLSTPHTMEALFIPTANFSQGVVREVVTSHNVQNVINSLSKINWVIGEELELLKVSLKIDQRMKICHLNGCLTAC